MSVYDNGDGGLLSKIRGRLRHSGTKADKPVVHSYLDTRGTTHTKNIGITNVGTLFPFNSTTLKKPLKVRRGKWFNASDYFASTVGLNTNYTVLIDDTHYVVKRMDRKRGKVWLSQQDTRSTQKRTRSKQKIAPTTHNNISREEIK